MPVSSLDSVHAWYYVFVSSWYVMYPLVLCSILTLVVILDRLLFLRDSAVFRPELSRAILDLRYGGKTTLVEQLSADEETPLARLARACLMYSNWPKEENAQAVQAIARREIMRLERGLVFLEVFAGMAPLLGLMGTIFGLIRIFSSANSTGDLSAQGVQIAVGISEAMYTTVSGLLVAIPALIAFNLLSRWVEAQAVELESLCSELLGKIYTQPEVSAEAVGEEIVP